jgi:hypothetical protein
MILFPFCRLIMNQHKKDVTPMTMMEGNGIIELDEAMTKTSNKLKLRIIRHTYKTIQINILQWI